MGFLKFDLGKQKTGRVVKITLSGSIANVLLLNNSNMYNYEHGHEYTSIGGLVNKALVEMKIPGNDHWFIVVDKKGLTGAEGKTDASVNLV